MKTFAIGDYGFEVISHETVIPDVANETVEERFVIAHYHQGKPLQVSNPPDFPRQPHWEKWTFAGKLAQDVYAPFDPTTNEQLEEHEAEDRRLWGEPIEMRKVGTKRGADIRSTFFPQVYRRSLAVIQGVRMGTIDDAEVEAAIQDLKAQMLEFSLDEAIAVLKGEVRL